MFIDHYGVTRAVQNPNDLPLVYIKDPTTTANTVYKCFFDGNPRAIQRTVTENGIETTTWAWGDWDDRATLDYAPINNTISQ